MTHADIKALNAELDAEVVCEQGWTRGELSAAFDLLHDEGEHWKEPIGCVIPHDKLLICAEACRFFTGTELVMKARVINKHGDLCMVTAVGYLMGPCGP